MSDLSSCTKRNFSFLGLFADLEEGRRRGKEKEGHRESVPVDRHWGGCREPWGITNGRRGCSKSTKKKEVLGDLGRRYMRVPGKRKRGC